MTPGRWPWPSVASSTTPSLRARLGAAGRQRVLGRFTWQVTAGGTAEYRALLEAARCGGWTMLTVDYGRLGVRSATGCSTSGVVSVDMPTRRPGWAPRWWPATSGPTRSASVQDTFGAMAVAGELDPVRSRVGAVQGDALALPFADDTFDRVIASEILEHIPDDEQAMAELARVFRPGGTMAITVPRTGPEFVNWALSDEYHKVPGGHIRIYRQRQLVERLEGTGMRATGHHHAHGLHAPYWWLKCLVARRTTATRPWPPTTGSWSGTSRRPRP